MGHSQCERQGIVQLRHTSIVLGLLQSGALSRFTGLSRERRYTHVAYSQEEVGKIVHRTQCVIAIRLCCLVV